MSALKKRSALILLLASAFSMRLGIFQVGEILVFVELFEVAVLKTSISKKVSDAFGTFFKKVLKTYLLRFY